MGTGRTFMRRQGFDVRPDLHLLAGVVGPPMMREEVLAIDDTDAVPRGQYRHRRPHMGVRYAVVVEVKAHVRCLVYLDLLALFAREGLGVGGAYAPHPMPREPFRCDPLDTADQRPRPDTKRRLGRSDHRDR